MRAFTGEGRVTAVLGPTNTGKTHLAVERMLGHSSGMIGCPLRLLAREIYDRVASARGAGAVALVTGEEKIVPARPRYFVCTVESMPLDRQVEFMAVDEIQLAADPDRGHVFTDRLLHARGLSETMFLGAATIGPLIRRLVPEAEFVSRPRFSRLVYAGERKITRLKPRSAVVAFSAADVYALAEVIRRLRGGAAVVLGALSPRTRNAQVAMFQAGEVDYLVATDAVGMGLNLQVDHVAFAELRKFDGHAARDLTAAEVAQIAGRAGRHMRDGSFGTTGDVGALGADVVAAVEEHRFPPLARIYWRNTRLELASVKALIRSLEARPPVPGLVRPREAEDLVSLRTLVANPDLAKLAVGYDAVSLLWEVCRIPDFRKILTDAHTRLLTRIYLHLAGPTQVLPDDWVNRLVDRLDHCEGDIDVLAGRIAHIRTWNYVAHRPDWVTDAGGLQERARAIEDRLSDALHERLTQRFVDRRGAALIRHLEARDALAATIGRDGMVSVEGEQVGRLSGLRFEPDDIGAWREGRSLRAAVRRALAPKLVQRLAKLERAADKAFALAPDGNLIWDGGVVGRIAAGPTMIEPTVEVPENNMIEVAGRERVRRRLRRWLRDHLERVMAPLGQARAAELAGPARGLAYQVVEALGSVPRSAVSGLVDDLEPPDRKALARLGIRLGRDTVFMPAMLKGAALAARAQLWSVYHGTMRDPPPPGRVSVPLDATLPPEFYGAVGYRIVGPLAIRVDILERLGVGLRRRARVGPFPADRELLTLIGAQAKDFAGVLAALGYHPVVDSDGDPDSGILYAPRRRRPGPGRQRGRRPQATESPFAALRQLKLGAR